MKWIVPIALVFLAACSGSGEGTNPEPVALVTLGKAETGAIADMGTVYGEVLRSGDSQMVLAAPTEAVIETIVPPGSAVRRRQVVAQLRASPQALAMAAAAKADAAAAAEALARAIRLREQGFANDGDVETARSHAAAAEALQLAFARQLSGLALRSPAAGFVDTLGAAPGEIVPSGATVATLSRKDSNTARFGVPASLARRLATGAKVMVQSDIGAFPATVVSVSPDADPQTRLGSLLARLPANTGLAAGQPVSASIATRVNADAIIIPYAAVLDDGGQPYVFVVRNSVAHRHDIVTGARDGGRVAVAKGLKAGDMVVTAGGTALADGMKVRTR